jgi:hypothetical protein
VLEIAIVAATLALLGAGSLATGLAPDALVVAGAWILAAGLGFGLPTGAVYHLELRRALTRSGALPRRWWLHPTSHHGLVPAEDAPRVLFFCRAGALGCAVAFLGCAVVALGAWHAARAG